MKVAIAALLISLAITGCAAESPQIGQSQTAGTQAPSEASNPVGRLEGIWAATYPGGPLRVVIDVDLKLGGRHYVATLIDGNASLPAGQVVWRGAPDPKVSGLIPADQICSDHGITQARWVKAKITAQDSNNLIEELVNPADCGGFPVRFWRMSPPQPRPQGG
ncbi:MAG TPA: hypothetical protein VMU16_11700 [Candidatus Binataceae bacterium]|nr:hypothetical protein [Candidatus Binataceae bacterium]